LGGWTNQQLFALAHRPVSTVQRMRRSKAGSSGAIYPRHIWRLARISKGIFVHLKDAQYYNKMPELE